MAGVAKAIGILVTIERVTRLRQKLIYARFITNIDITKPLRKYIEINIECGRTQIQPIFYENIPIESGICKSYDHYVKDYLEKKARAKDKRAKKKSDNMIHKSKKEWKIVPKGKGWENKSFPHKNAKRTPSNISKKV